MLKDKKKMPKCKCGRVWLWDWCNDTHVNERGTEYKRIQFENSVMEFGADVMVCKCGRINAVSVFHAEIGEEVIHPKGHRFNNVDWETEGHYAKT